MEEQEATVVNSVPDEAKQTLSNGLSEVKEYGVEIKGTYNDMPVRMARVFYTEDDLRLFSYFVNLLDKNNPITEDHFVVELQQGDNYWNGCDFDDIIHVIRHGKIRDNFPCERIRYQNLISCLRYLNNGNDDYLQVDHFYDHLNTSGITMGTIEKWKNEASTASVFYDALNKLYDLLLSKKKNAINAFAKVTCIYSINLQRNKLDMETASAILSKWIKMELNVKECKNGGKFQYLIPDEIDRYRMFNKSDPVSMEWNFVNYNNQCPDKCMNFMMKLFDEMGRVKNAPAEIISTLDKLVSIFADENLYLIKIRTSKHQVTWLAGVFLEIADAIHGGDFDPKGTNLSVYNCLRAHFVITTNCVNMYGFGSCVLSVYYILLGSISSEESYKFAQLLLNESDKYYSHLCLQFAENKSKDNKRLLNTIIKTGQMQIWPNHVSYAHKMTTQYHHIVRFCVDDLSEDQKISLMLEIVRFGFGHGVHRDNIIVGLINIKTSFSQSIASLPDNNINIYRLLGSDEEITRLFNKTDQFGKFFNGEQWLMKHIAPKLNTINKFEMGLAVCKAKYYTNTNPYHPKIDWAMVDNICHTWVKDLCGLDWKV